MSVLVEKTNRLIGWYWPACDWEAGRAIVAAGSCLLRGVEPLAWVKASRVADNTAMTNPVRVKRVSAEETQSDVRMEKVELLRAAIANGSYAVSSEALADKLIEHMRELDESGEPGRRR